MLQYHKMNIDLIKKPDLYRLFTLTDSHGIIQHSKESIPDLEHGYASDDNSRALIAVNELIDEYPEHKIRIATIQETYMKNLVNSQAENGKFYCYLNKNLQGSYLGGGPWLGRSLMACGHTFRNVERFRKTAMQLVDRSRSIITSSYFCSRYISLRTISFLTFMFYYLDEKRDSDLKILVRFKHHYVNKLTKNASAKWFWPEKTITYDNGKIIQTYFLLGLLLEDNTIIELGKKTLDFYLSITFDKGYFQVPGNKGFWTEKRRPLFDEQPLEAYSLCSALISAYLILRDNHYLDLAYHTHQWFYGKNRLKIPMIDHKTGGVYDGLMEKGFNRNQGAENIVSLLLSYAALKKMVHI